MLLRRLAPDADTLEQDRGPMSSVFPASSRAFSSCLRLAFASSRQDAANSLYSSSLLMGSAPHRIVVRYSRH
jgi:hypothetical protein